MKKQILIGLTLLSLGNVVLAQTANRVSAYNYLRSGELSDAKKYIDLASDNENTKIDPKTWYYRAQIYDAIVFTKDDKYKGIDADAQVKANDAWVKLNDLDTKKNYTDDTKLGLVRAFTSYYNKGVEAYKGADYIASQSNLQTAYDFKKKYFNETDTSTYYYVGISAEKNSKFDEAKKIYRDLIAMKFGGARLFLDLENACIQSKDDAGAIEAVKMGRIAYPNDKNLILEEMYSAIRAGKTNEAINNVKLAIDKEPNNANLYYILGTLCYNAANPSDKTIKITEAEKKEYSVKSIENLKKSTELNPNVFDSQYQLGVIYFNEAVALNAAANNIKDPKKYDIESKKAENKFREALPFFEKSKSIDTNEKSDKKTLYTNMKQLYLIIGDMQKFKEMDTALKAL